MVPKGPGGDEEKPEILAFWPAVSKKQETGLAKGGLCG